MKLILASSSQRRIEMLKNLGINPKIIKPLILEKKRFHESAVHYVQRLALEKAIAASKKTKFSKSLFAILAADTIVILGRQIIEKPSSRKNAYEMLKKLSGKNHLVITGWCWLLQSKNGILLQKTFFETTKVSFAKRSDSFWRWYAGTTEPKDKAGAYAAQGIGLSFIERLEGSYSNVIGLPLSKVIESFHSISGKNFYDVF